MRVLYIYPHPDDESFGPARGMAALRRQGHQVYLLTLTRGEATKMRHKLGLSLAEMGELRYQEMLNVQKTLGLDDLVVLNLPDSGLKHLDPRKIEGVIADEIRHVQPHVVVTYPVHGISGFHDHIVTHAAVKRVFLELKENGRAPSLQRLAFETLTEVPADHPWHLNLSKPEEIGCAFEATEADMALFHKALDCYVTYKDVIAETKIHELGSLVQFELFQEMYQPPLKDLCDGLTD